MASKAVATSSTNSLNMIYFSTTTESLTLHRSVMTWGLLSLQNATCNLQGTAQRTAYSRETVKAVKQH